MELTCQQANEVIGSDERFYRPELNSVLQNDNEKESTMNIKNQHIALVGVSSDPDKYGYKIFTDLIKNGYQVTGVNPKTPIVEGQQTVATLAEVKKPIDLVIIVTPPQVSIEVIKQANKLGIKNIWLQPGAESEAAIELAKELGINLTYNACFMMDQKIWIN